jgi:hypothetical protein
MSVLAQDLDVGPAHVDRDDLDEDRPATPVRLGDLFEVGGLSLDSTVMALTLDSS